MRRSDTACVVTTHGLALDPGVACLLLVVRIQIIGFGMLIMILWLGLLLNKIGAEHLYKQRIQVRCARHMYFLFMSCATS